MNIKNIIQTTQKPEMYQPGTAFMWSDEHISSQLLAVHLSQDVDLASRKESTIQLTIDWIGQKAPGADLRILDLGCGPGLYTEKLAGKGHNVTGIDLSPASIAYARESAQKKQLPIEYRQQNYLELEEENSYDLALMIFADFGVLMPDQRRRLLEKTRRALKPGGVFIFDALNTHYDFKSLQNKNWEMATEGFWRNSPHLVLSESFVYEERSLCLNQHIVIGEDDDFEVYRFWTHAFTHADLVEACRKAGFAGADCYDNVIPDSQMYRSKDVTFCVAAK